MPGPILGCGKEHQPACPPTPAAVFNGMPSYTQDQILQHGSENYEKGLKDAASAVNAVIEDPNHGWSEGEMARAIRKAIQEQ